MPLNLSNDAKIFSVCVPAGTSNSVPPPNCPASRVVPYKLPLASAIKLPKGVAAVTPLKVPTRVLSVYCGFRCARGEHGSRNRK